MLVLSDLEVASLLNMAEAIEAVEGAFREMAAGTAVMPAKSYLQFPKYGGDLRVMPASVGDEFAGVKIVNSHPGNPKLGLPTVAGTYLLLAQATGLPLALMGATAMTGIRTGAGSAVASKYLAQSDSSSLGLVGAGVQAAYQLRAINEVFKLKRVVVWAPAVDRARREDFVTKLSLEFPAMDISGTDSLDAACEAEIICTTTPSRTPVVSRGLIGPGTHINAVGADGPGKQELDSRILQDAVVVIDEWHQAIAGGEVNVPMASGELTKDQIHGSLAELITGKIPGRTTDDQITVFDSTGLAIQDIAVASVVYRIARERKIGSYLE